MPVILWSLTALFNVLFYCAACAWIWSLQCCLIGSWSLCPCVVPSAWMWPGPGNSLLKLILCQKCWDNPDWIRLSNGCKFCLETHFTLLYTLSATTSKRKQDALRGADLQRGLNGKELEALPNSQWGGSEPVRSHVHEHRNRSVSPRPVLRLLGTTCVIKKPWSTGTLLNRCFASGHC